MKQYHDIEGYDEPDPFDAPDENVHATLFPHDLSNEFIYQGESRGEAIKKLSHILEFTSLIIAVQGPQDAGKTTLLKQRFIREPKPNWNICFIDAGAHSNINQLSEIFSRQLGTRALNMNDQRSITSFVEHLDNLRESALTTIIIIDNAEHLSDQAAEFVIQLAQHEENIQPLVRLVLSYAKMPANVISLLPSQNSYDYIKTLEIKPLTFAETEDFIYQALDRIGYEGQGPFNQKLLRQIYRESDGYIHIIQRIAEFHWHRFINQREKLAVPKRNTTHQRKSVLPRIAFALAAGLIASLLLLTGTDEGSIGPTTELALPTEEDSNMSTLVQNNVDTSPKRSSLIIRPQDNSSLTTTKTDRSEISKAAAKPSFKSSTEASTNIASSVSTVDAKLAHQPHTAALSRPENISPTTNREPSLPIETGGTQIRQGDWLKRQGTNTFTLQLVGGSNENAIKEFIKRNKIEDKAAYYQTRKNGKPWFAVVYGVFDNNKDALMASKEISRTTATKPWIRPMASIHQDLGMTAFASQ